jgi:pimeloyl-ACP methyl ester carboxylesterase
MDKIRYKEYDIHYVLEGDITKPVIVLLNGIMMSSISWEIFKDDFTKDTCLLRYDMVDQGGSSKATKQYTQELQVEVLRHLLQELNLPKVNLVGISYGTSIALQYVIKYPEDVDKLFIANGVAKTKSWLKAIGDGWNQVGRTRDGEAYYNITIPYIYSPEFYNKNIEWMNEREKILIPLFSDPNFLDSMERLTISAETHDVVDDLETIKHQTLIVGSDLDFLTPFYEQEFLYKKIENSELVLIEDCGHASMYEQKDVFTKLVLDFIGG